MHFDHIHSPGHAYPPSPLASSPFPQDSTTSVFMSYVHGTCSTPKQMGPPLGKRPEGEKVRKDRYVMEEQKRGPVREKKGAGKRGARSQGGYQLNNQSPRRHTNSSAVG